MKDIEDAMVYVPLGILKEGISNSTNINDIKKLITSGAEYCSEGIAAILGVQVSNKVEND